MAQHDYVIANGTGAAVRSDLNNALAAIVSQNSGATAPATTYAFQFWADTTTGLLKLRNSANSAWVTLFQLDGEWSTLPVENGTAAAPSIYFKDSGTDTGFYSPGTDQIGISTAGTSRLTIDANGNLAVDTNTLYVDAPNNRVGIGVSDPGQVLVIGGGTNGRARMKVTSGAGNFGKFEFSTDSSSTASTAQVAEITASIVGTGPLTSSLQFATNAGNSLTNAMTIDSSQRVGIGSTPAAKLDIKMSGATRTDGVIIRRSTNDNHQIGLWTTGGDMYFDAITDNAAAAGQAVFRRSLDSGSTFNESARIDASGRLLVGTSTADTSRFGTSTYTPQFQVKGAWQNGTASITCTNDYPALWLNGTGGTSAGAGVGIISFNGYDGTNYTQAAAIKAEVDGTASANDMPGRLVFSTTADGASSPTERMRITCNGHMLLGATSVVDDPRFGLVHNGNSNMGAVWNNTSAVNQSEVAIRFYRNSSAVGNITTSLSATAYNTSSDYRLKENVTAVTDGIYRLQQLKPSRFNFIADPDHTVDGFIAHEVQDVVPESIYGEKDAIDADGNPIYQGIDQSKLVPLLTAALQEAIGEIESLKARVAALEAA